MEVSVTESGAAVSGTPPTQVTFAADSANATLSVATEDDEAVEDASTVTATVSSGTGYTVDGASGSADVVVEDDDAASLSGAPRNLRVEVSTHHTRLNVSWEAPASDGDSQITGYKIQYKESTDDIFRYEVVVSSDLSILPHNVTLRVHNGREYTVRVVATNAFGDGPPSEEASATPLTWANHLRVFIEKDIVETYEAAHPWLRKAWAHINRPGFVISVPSNSAFGGQVGTSCGSGTGDTLASCRAVRMSIRRGNDTSVPIIVHEMAHVYTLANGLASSPGPLGVAHVYFEGLNLGSECRAEELYADILTTSVLPNEPTSYWDGCNGANTARTQEALAIVRSTLRGEMPAWFGTTYGSTDPDLERFWSNVKEVSNFPVGFRRAVVYQLRNEFGGYCSNRTTNESANGDGAVRNPWSDGGCVPGAPGNVAAITVGIGNLSVSWNAPGDDGGAPVEGYKVQWKSGSQDYDTSRQALVTDPDDQSHLIEGLNSGTEHTVRVVAYNANGDGAETGEVSATPSAVDDVAPTLTTATMAGSTLTLTWNEDLDSTSVPATSAFTVNVNGTRRGITAIVLAGEVVTLTLAKATKTVDALTVSYTPPSEAGAKAIQDVAQNKAAAFSGRTVANESDIEIVSVALTSDPGSDGVYAYGKGGGSTRETIEATVAFSENVTVTGAPELWVSVATGVGVVKRPSQGIFVVVRPSLVYHSGSGTASLTFRRVVEEGDSETSGIRLPEGNIYLNGGTILGGSGRDAVLAHEGLAAQSGHRVDGVRPTLAGASRDSLDYLTTAGTGSAVVNGNTVTLIYNEALDETLVPTPGYGFKVWVGGTRSAVYRGIVDGGTVQTVSDIAVNGSELTLTLAASVAHDAEVRVDYGVPYYRNSAAITDVVGNQARNFYSDVIDNVTVAAGAASVTALALASSPGADRTYAIGDAIDVRVTYSASVTVGLSQDPVTSGDPRFEPTTGRWYREPTLNLTVGGETRRAAYHAGSGTQELTFRYTVVADDEVDADGVSIASGYIALNGATMSTGSSGPAAARVHPELTAQAGHLVDGERPTLSSASVDGDELTLAFNEALDGDAAPPESSFVVTVAGSPRAVDAVAVAGSAVTLTLSSGVTSGETVTMGYIVPTGASAKPIRDAVGNPAVTFADAEVTNAAAALPVVSIAASTTPVTEGTAAAFTLTRTGATDAALTVEVSVAETGALVSGTPSTSVTFAAGSDSATLSVATEDDEVVEDASTVTATVSPGAGYTVDGASGSGDVEVEDDDAAPVVTWTDLGNNWFGGFADAFSNPGWSEDEKDFRIWFISYDVGSREFSMSHDGTGGRIAEPGQLALHVGGLTVEPGAAISTFASAGYATVRDVDSQWQVGEQVTVRLTRTDGDAVEAPAGPGLSVADTQANEASGAPLRFRVTLDAPAQSTVSVRYRTSDGTAQAGADYVAAHGAVRFARGESAKTVDVAVLPDDHDEGSETMTLTLSGPYGATVADATATGTISNTGAIPKAWIARFGRTVAEQAIEAVQARLDAPRAPGLSGTIAGQSISGIAGPEPEAGEAWGAGADARQGLEALSGWFEGGGGDEDGLGVGARTLSASEVLSTSSFALTEGTAESGFAAFWGRGAVTRFDGRDGEMALDGEVASAMLGADFSRDALLGGLMVLHSRGEGGYRSPAGNGEVESTLTALFPYARYALSERVSVWGMGGYGEGTLTVTPEGQAPLSPDMDFVMGALGVRGVLLDGGDDGPTLAAKSDAFAVRTSTDAVSGSGGNLEASQADVTRVRFALEGSRPFGLGGDAVLTPSLELGVRHDGGDAETGFGADIGAGLALSDPARGLSAEVRARGLLTHEAQGMREGGLSGTLAFDPSPETERGLSLSLTQSVGAQGEGGVDALLERRTFGDLAAQEGDDLSARRLDARIGYGLGILDDRWTATPELGFGLSDRDRELRLGWRLTESVSTGLAFELGLEGTRRESSDSNASTGAEHGIGVGAGWRLVGPSRRGLAFDVRIEAARRDAANDDTPPDHTIGLELRARW